MSKSQHDLEEILDSANTLVRNVIAEIGRIVNTPTQEWSIASRKRALEALRVRAIEASARFEQWIEQGIWIKDIGKLCDSLAAIGSDAFHASLTDSRVNGRAYLTKDLRDLVAIFGDGCKCEPPTQINIATSTSATPPEKPTIDRSDRPYSIKELANLHNLSHDTIIRLYENEPGVLVLQSSPARRRQTGRRRRTIRVPHHVYLRVRRRLEVK